MKEFVIIEPKLSIPFYLNAVGKGFPYWGDGGLTSQKFAPPF